MLAPRQNDLQVTHIIRYDLTFNSLTAAQANAGVNIGTLPPGAVPVSVNAYVDVAFNNGTNNLFSVGLTALGTDFVNGGSLAAKASVLTPAPINAVALCKAATSKAGTPLYLSTSQTGTAATAGQVSVVVAYHPPLG